MSEPRRATSADAEALTALRAEMFRTMGQDASDPAWLEACTAHFRQALAEAHTVGFVVDAPEGQGLAASGVIEFKRGLPGPTNPSGWLAYISTMSTWPRWQRLGHARDIFANLLREADARGVARVELHATESGAPLYRAFGFVERGGGLEMRLRRD